MKTRILRPLPILTAIATLVLLGSTVQSHAQANDTRVTASPKYLQFLKSQGAPMDKTASKALPATQSVGYQATGSDGITASPKYRQVLNEQYAQVDAQLNNPQVTYTSVAYRATGDDGITTSPKNRQLLDEHKSTIQVAPLK